MITIYAEKPDVGNKIATALGEITLASGKKVDFSTRKASEKAIKSQQYKDGYLEIKFKGEPCFITWGYGHLCELKQAYDYDADYKNWNKLPLPFIPKKHELKVKDDAKKQFNIIKSLFQKSNTIINATDPDREGEVIFAYVHDLVKTKASIKRALFTSQTKEGFVDAFNNLKDGKEMKPLCDAGRGRSIADADVGNNMTVATTLKYGNSGVLSIGRVQTPTLNILVEREKAIKNHVAVPYFVISGEFESKDKGRYKGTHKRKRFDKRKEAEDTMAKIKGKNGIISNINKETIRKEAPNLYSQDSLQMDCNANFGLSLKETLEISQFLYEKGYTTYPRTDSQFLTEDMEPVINKVLNSLESTSEYQSYIKGKKREFKRAKYFNNAKVTSHFAIIPTGIIPKGLSPIQQKVYDLIAKSVISMLYKPAEIEKTTITTEVEKEQFITVGNVIKLESWMELYGKSKEEFLPSMNKGDVVTGDYLLSDKKTEPPKKYTQKTLLAAMISAGKELDDVDLKKIMADPSVGGIGTTATRANIVDTLLFRGYAKKEKNNIVATEKGIALIDTLPIEDIKSPKLTAMWEMELNKIAKGETKLEDFLEEVYATIEKWCNIIAKDTGGKKNALSNNKNTKEVPKEDDLICPSCKGVIRKMSWGWGCSEYRSGCKFSISGTIAGKKITDSQVKKLIAKGSTGVIKGFKSNKGDFFPAEIILDENYKTKFVYAS